MLSPWPALELIWVSHHDWKAGRTLSPELSDRWVFWLVRAGTMELTLDGQPYKVSAGQACLQKGGLRRELRAQTAARWDSAGFRVRPHPLHRSIAPITVWQPEPAEHTLLDATFPLLNQWHGAGTPGAANLASAALQTMLALGLEQSSTSGTDAGHPAWLQLALERLEGAPRRDLTELSREVGYSPAQFRARFQALTGTPPRDYAAACLDRQARHLLLTTDLSIDQIAAQLHFSATAHFIRFFKRANGTTPARFRRGSGGV